MPTVLYIFKLYNDLDADLLLSSDVKKGQGSYSVEPVNFL
jgi:hypothetical protein